MKILSTDINDLSHNKRNIQAANRMNIQAMLRSLDIEQRGEILYIEGSLNHAGHINEFELEISSHGEIFSHYCTCSFHRPNDACGHIIALCSYLAQREYKLPYHFSREENDGGPVRVSAMIDYERMLQRQAMRETHNWLRDVTRSNLDLHLSFDHDEPIRLYMIFEMNRTMFYDHLSLSLKIGHAGKKMYVVKDILQLLAMVDEGTWHQYGKGLEFYHDLEAFDEESRDILSMLRTLCSNDDLGNCDKRYIYLSMEGVERMLDLLTRLPQAYYNIHLEPRPLHLSIQIGREKEAITIQLLDIDSEGEVIERGTIGNKALYDFDDAHQRLVCYEADDDGRICGLLQRLNSSRLLMSEDDFSLFNQVYLIGCREFISWEGSLDGVKIEEMEHQIRVFLDVDESGQELLMKLEFCYDQKSAYGFERHADSLLSPNADAIEQFLSRWVVYVDERHFAHLQPNLDWGQMTEELPRLLSPYCEIYVSEQLRKAARPKQLSMNIGVHMDNDLLTLDFDLEGMDMKELQNVLKSYRRKKKFHRLKNGEMIDLDGQAVKEASDLFEQLQLNGKDLEKGSVTLPGYRLYNVDVLSGEQEAISYDRSSILKEEELFLAQPQEYEIPANYASRLRDYQKEGYQWLRTLSACNLSGLLADDMGLGKTIQILAYLESQREAGKLNLVVCPASLVLNWHDEVNKFQGKLKALAVYGSRSEREKLLKDAQDYDLLITSYDYLKRDPDLYHEMRFDTVILDEAQYISNPRTKNAQCVKQLNCRQRFALSGTPIENTLTELWSIYDFLLPGYLYTHGVFSDLFEKPIIKDKDEKATKRLQRLVRPFLLRRTKQEVLQELPDKEEHVLQFHFEPKERELYLANAAGIRKEIESGLDTSRDSIAILALITRLRQLCQDARLVYENVDWVSSKLQGCMELVRSCIQAGHKILLFSSFTSMLDLIHQEMEKEGISCYVLTGSLPKEKRREYVETFQHDDTPVFMISLKAGGTGLNLTAADVVIHFDPWWNLSAQNQATDRAHRIGQHNNVQVYSLIMKGTIEEKIQDLQQKKSDLAQLFVNTQNTNLLRDMSREELLDLFSGDV